MLARSDDEGATWSEHHFAPRTTLAAPVLRALPAGGLVALWSNRPGSRGDVHSGVSRDGGLKWAHYAVAARQHPEWEPALAIDGVGGLLAAWTDYYGPQVHVARGAFRR